MTKASRALIIAALALALVVTTGCGGGSTAPTGGPGPGPGPSSGKLTKENVDKISADKTTDKEVTDLLGAPSDSTEVEIPVVGKVKQSVYKDGNKVLTLQFKDGKVMSKVAVGF